jgi:hypothetical protein
MSLTTDVNAYVPDLIDRTKFETLKVVAYIVSVLVKLGALRTSAPLRELRATYQAIEPKTEWIYAVIGQCNLAIATLEQAEVIS